jgi:hypothetical protein
LVTIIVDIAQIYHYLAKGGSGRQADPINDDEGRSLLLFGGEQLEVGGLETAIDDIALHFGLAYSVAEAGLAMGITEIVDLESIDIVGLAFYAYREFAAFAIKAQLALTTGGFDILNFLVGIRLASGKSLGLGLSNGTQAAHGEEKDKGLHT